MLVGRGQDCDIVLGHPTISSQHCVVECHDDDGQWHIEDLESTNGTFVNGVRVDEIPLSPGDIVGIGKSWRFRFESIE